MGQKKTLKALFAISFVLGSCAKIEINDHEWCSDIGPEGAFCFHTLSEKERQLDKAQWDKERFGQVCTTAQNFGEVKAAILKLCGETKLCDYELQQNLSRLTESLEEVERLKVQTP